MENIEKIAIIGAGGFGREVKCLIDDINSKEKQYEVIGFFDDNIEVGKSINGIKNLGSIESINNIDYNLNIALGVGVPEIKKKLISSINNTNIKFPNLIHPNVIKSTDDVAIGIGNIICAGNIITCNIDIQDFVTLNLSCTVGHDTTIKSYSSFMPSVNISGEVIIEENVYVGTGAKIINNLSIGTNTIVGAGAVVSKSLPENCTAVGIPAKPIKFHN
ncbi:sugar O-acyltransferase (sialic acid O-acetyltransferase NeuD family) [Lacinutrix venerupis]|uniref:NeuD/PglB/VioB family sugar acetyltransferase n=1 Tax=Lacinutrix venerupis TaxID=1486034 RepID=UPI000EB46E9F|nr:NeuD/PglB/VioB family sugar acetyltransferase [Lacinutrix venerupis]RLJ63280.1 sugar O-acyltransferase (sialic acid O-acetyltransferase NeuD family) [Lacinutrix venerupis]